MQKKQKTVEELQRRLEQSEKDKKELSDSIEELNQCYSIKIEILEKTVEAYENRIQELLLWKKEYIDKELSSSAKYQEENKKLLGMIDQLYASFEAEKQAMKATIKQKDEEMQKMALERDEIMQKNAESEHRVDQLVKEHVREIEQLKKELSMLREQQITLNENVYRLQPTTESQLIQSLPEQFSEQENLQLKESTSSTQAHPLREIKNTNLHQLSKDQTELQKITQGKGRQVVYRSPNPNFHFSPLAG